MNELKRDVKESLVHVLDKNEEGETWIKEMWGTCEGVYAFQIGRPLGVAPHKSLNQLIR